MSRIRYALRDGISAVFGKTHGASGSDRGWMEIFPIDKYALFSPLFALYGPATDCILIGTDALEELSVSKSFSLWFYRGARWGGGGIGWGMWEG